MLKAATLGGFMLLALAAWPSVALAVGGITIEKSTNGHDADTAPGPQVLEGEPVTWTYVVTNVGGGDLTDVTVTDNQGVAVMCPMTTLTAGGGTMVCTAQGTATAGQYANLGSAVGTTPGGSMPTNSDPSHYLGVPRLVCNPGEIYFRQPIELVNPDLQPLTNVFDFVTPGGQVVGGQLTIVGLGDLDDLNEQWVVSGESGGPLGAVGGTGNAGDQCTAILSNTVPVPTNDLAAWAADGTVTLTAVDASAGDLDLLCGDDRLKLILETCIVETRKGCNTP